MVALEAEVLAGRVTLLVTVPEVQGTVEGRPVMAGVEENAQLVAPVTWAERATDPPAEPSDEGFAANAVTVGGPGAATMTLTAGALTVLEPVTARWKVYLIALDDVLAGRATLVLTAPEVQGTVAGRPLRVEVEENTQLVASVTWADRLTAPPPDPRDDGVAANEVTVGGVGLALAAGVAAWASEPVRGATNIPISSSRTPPARMPIRQRPSPIPAMLHPPYSRPERLPPDGGNLVRFEPLMSSGGVFSPNSVPGCLLE